MASSGRLEPGEEGKIGVRVDIKGKTGTLKKTVQVYTNDPQNPVIVLNVSLVVGSRQAPGSGLIPGHN